MDVEIYVNAIGVSGPGLVDWDSSQPIFSGEKVLSLDPVVYPEISLLKGSQGRHITRTMRLIHGACLQLVNRIGKENICVPTIFSSSSNDHDIADEIFRSLHTDADSVSPTSFHNSVHNAPVGYWTIALKNHNPYTSIAASNHSFPMGLIEAIAYQKCNDVSVVLGVYEGATPMPLHQVHPVVHPFAVALHLSPKPSPRSIVRLQVSFIKTGIESKCGYKELDEFQMQNAAARCFPLLCDIAAVSNFGKERACGFTLPNNFISITVSPV